MMWLNLWRSRGECFAPNNRGLEVHGTYHQERCREVLKARANGPSDCWIEVHNFLQALAIVSNEAQQGLYFVKPCRVCFARTPGWDDLLP